MFSGLYEIYILSPKLNAFAEMKKKGKTFCLVKKKKKGTLFSPPKALKGEA
jgi:hypothetical protein